MKILDLHFTLFFQNKRSKNAEKETVSNYPLFKEDQEASLAEVIKSAVSDVYSRFTWTVGQISKLQGRNDGRLREGFYKQKKSSLSYWSLDIKKFKF